MQPQNRSVGHKLLLYTILMFTFPLLSFFVLRDGPPSLSPQWSALGAVLAANVVIAAYCWMAFSEEEPEETEEERRGRSGKAVGVFGKRGKERTD
jgi:hypothetical protein